MTEQFIDYSLLKPVDKCTWCNGTGNGALPRAGVLNYIRCRECGGTDNKNYTIPLLEYEASLIDRYLGL